MTYTVNTESNNLPSTSACAGAAGDCSLRQALALARAGDTVVLPASSIPYAIVHEAIPVAGGVTIEGAASAATTVSGEGADQAFNLLGGGPVAIDGLTITATCNDSGEDEAGAITGEASDDPLTLEGVTISDSESPTGYGGAIEIGSSIVIAHSRFEGDSTTSGGGGAIDVLPSARSVNISYSVFAGDYVDSGSGGALMLESTDSLSVLSSTFSGDTAAVGNPRRGDPARRGDNLDRSRTAHSAGMPPAAAGRSRAQADSLAAERHAGGQQRRTRRESAATSGGTTVVNTIFVTRWRRSELLGQSHLEGPRPGGRPPKQVRAVA